MASIFNKRVLFFATCIPFFLFFIFFDLVLYPNASSLHPSLEAVQKVLGSSGGLGVLSNIGAHWTSALYYVVAEIYSSVSVGLLFWQFANDVVSIEQAKRFYPLFAQMSGLAPVVAGQYMVRYTSQATTFGNSLHRLTAAITMAGINVCVFYTLSRRFMARHEESSSAQKKEKKSKPKMSMMDSMKFLASSQYLRLVAALVIGYGLSINFTEIMWKSLVKVSTTMCWQCTNSRSI